MLDLGANCDQNITKICINMVTLGCDTQVVQPTYLEGGLVEHLSLTFYTPKAVAQCEFLLSKLHPGVSSKYVLFLNNE
jgi:hypothetical protein